MENRIQVNGVWYVKEDTNDDHFEIEISESNVTETLSCVWETSKWCFEATVLLREDADSLADHYPSPWMVITDKRPKERENWITQESDNPNWFLGVYENNPESMPEANEMFDKEGIKEFRAFIGYLMRKGWLIKSE